MVKTTAVTLLLLLTACAPTPPQPPGTGGYTYDPAANATIAARQAQDAGATYEAVQRATAVAIEQTTTAREYATAAAVQVVTQTAEAASLAATQMAVVATGTAESLSVQATSIALVAVQTGNAINAQATGMAVAAEQTRAAQEALNVEMARRDKERMLDNMRDREEMWTRNLPWIVGGLFVVGTGALAAIGAYLWWQKRPVINLTVNGRDVPLVLENGRGYKLMQPPQTLNDVLQLPAPRVTAVPPEPLPPLAEGHILIAGPTRSGKSTAMRALLQHRHDIVVLDPHAAPGDWGAAQVKGAGRNFDEIAAFMQWMQAELDRRAQARAMGITQFPEMTVATDEMPSIASELGRDTYAIWQKWVREGWKFGLYFVVSTQSTRVKTLGIEGEKDLLANFVAAILLGEEAANNYPDLITGMPRPAVIQTLHGAKPVLIPDVRPSPAHGDNGHAAPPAPPVINLPPQRSQAEIDGRKLEGVIAEFRSLNAAGAYLDPANPQRPSGQFLQERLRPALQWRVNHLHCREALRLLARYAN